MASSGATDGSLRPRAHSARSLICIADASAMLTLPIRYEPGRLAEPGAATLGTAGEGDRPVHKRVDMRLERLAVLGEERLFDLGDQPLMSRQIVDLHLHRLSVKEVVDFFLGVLADRFVRVQETRLDEGAHCPEAVHGVAGDGDRALGQRLGVVVKAEPGRYRRPCLNPRTVGTCHRCG